MPSVTELGERLKQQYPEFNREDSAALGRRQKAAYPDRYRDYTDTPDAPRAEGIYEHYKTDLSLGARAGEADIAHTVGNAMRAVPPLRGAAKNLEAYAQRTAPTQKELAGREGISDIVAMGVGQLPSQIVKFAPAYFAGRYAPLAAGAIGAVGAADKGLKQAAITGAETAGTWAVMEGAGKIKNTPVRIAATAAAQGIPAALEGGSKQQVTAATLMGGAFGIVHPNERVTPAKAREALKGGLDAGLAFKDDLARDLAPQTRGSEARMTAKSLRENLGHMYGDSARAEFAMKEARSAFNKMPPAQTVDFLGAVEDASLGAKQATPQLTKFAGVLRGVLDDARERVTAETGRLKNYYTDYFPHLWKDPDKATEFVRNFYASKRPLAGTGARFKPRTYPTIAEGLAAGLEMAYENPVDAVEWTVRDLDRFVMANRVKKELRPPTPNNPEGRGILRFVRNERPTPNGFADIRNARGDVDSVFKVYAKTPKRIRTDKGLATPLAARPPLKEIGRWVAPEPAARVVNNYLSPGLAGHPWYRGLRTIGNVMNQAQLGLSFFHAGFTSIDSVVSKMALGIERVMEGVRNPRQRDQITAGLRDIVASPAAPITTAFKGYNLKRAIEDPASAANNPHLQQIAQWFEMAGGRVGVDPVYKTNLAAKMGKAFREQQPLLGMLRVPGAMIDLSSRLVMEHFVPWQKLGVFADLAEFEIGRLNGRPRDNLRAAAQSAWDSADNRLGQLVYDNLFWNRVTKDLGLLAIRSVGWNLGTIREVMGGVKDWGSLAKTGVTERRLAEFTHRMAYVVALPVVVGTMGAMMHYLMNGTPPETWKDYLAPRTGHKDERGHDERVWLPSYLRDVYHYMTSPLQTVKGKVHPMFDAVSQLLNNEDFYGNEIANRRDPLIAQLMQAAGYTAEQFSPISFRTMAEREEGPETPNWEKLATFIGVTPAPARLKKSDAENVAADALARHEQKGARTLEEQEYRTAMHQITAAIRAHTDARPIWEMYRAKGVVSDAQVIRRGKTAVLDRSPLYADFRNLPHIEEVFDVWEAATPQEKKQLSDLMVKRLANFNKQFGSVSDVRRGRILEELAKIGEAARADAGSAK